MTQQSKNEKYAELIKESNPGQCQACGGMVSMEKVNLEDFQDGKLFLMEGIPAYVCQECGEVWVPEPIIKEFENMIETTKKHHQATKKNKKGGNKNEKK